MKIDFKDVNVYLPIQDDDGHTYLCESDEQYEIARLILSQDYHDWTEWAENFISNLKTLDGDNYYLILKSDLDG